LRKGEEGRKIRGTKGTPLTFSKKKEVLAQGKKKGVSRILLLRRVKEIPRKGKKPGEGGCSHYL